jgi:hypothetical protein
MLISYHWEIEDLDARVCSWCLLARQSPSLKRKETRKKQWGRKRTIAEEKKSNQHQMTKNEF